MNKKIDLTRYRKVILYVIILDRIDWMPPEIDRIANRADRSRSRGPEAMRKNT